MSRDLGRHIPDLEKFPPENFGLIDRFLEFRNRAEYGFGEYGFRHRAQ